MTSATFDPRGFDAEPEVLEPERMSILAILGLVFGLICFIPFLPLLGVIFSIAGLIAISRSRGRLAGTGMAIAGLILGLLFTALWGAVALGMAQALSIFSKELVSPAGSIAAAIDTGDHDAVRQSLVPEFRDLATDASIDAFKDGYKDELGAFNSVPTGVDLVMAYFELGPQFQAMQGMQGVGGRQDLMPVPARFDKGAGLFLMTFEQPAAHKNQPPTSGQLFRFRNISLVTPSGKVYNLIDPAKIPQAPPPVILPPPPGEQPPPPPAADAPKDAEPKPESSTDDSKTGSGGG